AVAQLLPVRGAAVPTTDTAREVQVEDGVEHRPLRRTVQQGRRQPLAQQLPVGEPEGLDRSGRVHGLPGADPYAVRAQRADQGGDPPVDIAHSASRSSLAAAFCTSSWCLRITPRVSRTTDSSSVPAPRASRVFAQSTVSATDGALRRSIARSAPTT